MDSSLIIKLTPFFISLVLGIIVIPHMRLVASGSKVFLPHSTEDHKDSLKVGGISMFPIILIALCISIALPYAFELTKLRSQVEATTMRIMQLVVGCSLLFIAGLKNDLNGTTGMVKLSTILLAAVMFPATGLWIDNLHGLFGIRELPDFVGMPLTVILVLYIMATFSLLDGLDGLSSGVGSSLLFVFLVFSMVYNSVLISFVSAAALGVALPFYLYSISSRSWRNTIMGRSGTYIIGYIISYLSVGLAQSTYMPDGMMMICLGALFVPLIDILRVIRSRVRDRRTLSRPDRNQLNHLLVRTGMPHRLIPATIVILIGLFVAMNAYGVLSHWNPNILLALDVILWVAIRLVIRYFIKQHETTEFHKEWEMAYGEDSWYNNIPRETLRRKEEKYGSMELPAYMISASIADYIPDGMSGFERSVKRLVDCTLSFVCLVVFSPLFLLSWLLIKFDDGGPAIFKQERIGRFGRPFYIYKFRTMRLDAEKDGPALSHAKGDDDNRLTKIGRFLRRHHLDELPQLWNVFKGDMAFIGYRPERKFYIDQIMKEDPRYAFLYQIRPGVTSYATLYNGYTDTMEKMMRRLELDLYYLGHRSWWFDIKILGLTFLNIIFGKKF